MTPDEAIRIVESKARGRTRYDGQEPFLDEVLVTETKRLRETAEIDQLALMEVTRQLCDRIDQENHHNGNDNTKQTPENPQE